jgi:hypothetical protein
VLPELASIRLAAYEDSGRFIGHRVLPVVGLCPGYRHVTLRTEAGQPLPLATLFLLIVVKDYVPDGLSDFAEALANPIKYQSELEKRAQQLAVLTDDMDVIEVKTDSYSQFQKLLAKFWLVFIVIVGMVCFLFICVLSCFQTCGTRTPGGTRK